MVVAAFIFFFVLFLAIGLAATVKSRGNRRDYYVASREVSPWVAGLSAVATNNSGYMFIGVIGYTYAVGLAAVWLMVGWIAGDFIASLFIHKKLRRTAGRVDAVTFGGILSRWNGTDFRVYRRIAAVITIVFLGAYAAAQLSAGGKALHVMFGWPREMGALLVAGVVVAYCFAGGIRASIWTDVAQSFVMMAAMTLLFWAGVQGLGGPAETWRMLGEIPGYLDWFPNDLAFPGVGGMALFAVGWMFAGFSVVGAPHVMVRFMALDKADGMARARVWYYGFYVLFYALATGVGLLSRLYLPELGGIDAELALPTMAQTLLPPVLVGLVLAGIFAATMSTADSLVLSCSAAATNDLPSRRTDNPWIIKLATLATAALALAIALSGTQSVFSLVILAWSVLASAFAPLLVVYALGGRPGEGLAIAMMVIGVGVALLWRNLGLHETIYEGMPGILAGLATFGLVRLLAPAPVADKERIPEKAS